MKDRKNDFSIKIPHIVFGILSLGLIVVEILMLIERFRADALFFLLFGASFYLPYFLFLIFPKQIFKFFFKINISPHKENSNIPDHERIFYQLKYRLLVFLAVTIMFTICAILISSFT